MTRPKSTAPRDDLRALLRENERRRAAVPKLNGPQRRQFAKWFGPDHAHALVEAMNRAMDECCALRYRAQHLNEIAATRRAAHDNLARATASFLAAWSAIEEGDREWLRTVTGVADMFERATLQTLRTLAPVTAVRAKALHPRAHRTRAPVPAALTRSFGIHYAAVTGARPPASGTSAFSKALALGLRLLGEHHSDDACEALVRRFVKEWAGKRIKVGERDFLMPTGRAVEVTDLTAPREVADGA
jgi:hypothetical protein